MWKSNCLNNDRIVLISPDLSYRPGGGIGILSDNTATSSSNQGGPPNRPLPPTPDDDAQGDRTLIMKRVSESHSTLRHHLIFSLFNVLWERKKARKKKKKLVVNWIGRNMGLITNKQTNNRSRIYASWCKSKQQKPLHASSHFLINFLCISTSSDKCSSWYQILIQMVVAAIKTKSSFPKHLFSKTKCSW